ncbi:hypothetical protein BD626DRAFT_538443 [Schizophyllum amplum]|uniref:Uncharacterized protein n=1 Tax=Schizophyllum amplum TaxID=97359 RepID=A0A550C7Y5_9AGAR|nr:hypothetical protein BD626DRAFT_538443 [Auriculariopsis ampla]
MYILHTFWREVWVAIAQHRPPAPPNALIRTHLRWPQAPVRAAPKRSPAALSTTFAHSEVGDKAGVPSEASERAHGCPPTPPDSADSANARMLTEPHGTPSPLPLPPRAMQAAYHLYVRSSASPEHLSALSGCSLLGYGLDAAASGRNCVREQQQCEVRARASTACFCTLFGGTPKRIRATACCSTPHGLRCALQDCARVGTRSILPRVDCPAERGCARPWHGDATINYGTPPHISPTRANLILLFYELWTTRGGGGERARGAPAGVTHRCDVTSGASAWHASVAAAGAPRATLISPRATLISPRATLISPPGLDMGIARLAGGQRQAHGTAFAGPVKLVYSLQTDLRIFTGWFTNLGTAKGETTNRKPQSTNRKPQTANHKPQTAKHKPQSTDYKLQPQSANHNC